VLVVLAPLPEPPEVAPPPELAEVDDDGDDEHAASTAVAAAAAANTSQVRLRRGVSLFFRAFTPHSFAFL
jgi:hypothetical protein